MSKEFGWWVDLAGVVLHDSNGKHTSWIHALPFGTYKHPVYGEMVFNDVKLNGLADSVKNNVRGIVPDIDYDHKGDPAKGNVAAGWVEAAEVRGNGSGPHDGLWLNVDWTDDGAKDIKAKKYRYFSAEFSDEWENAQGQKFKNVLFGGGITNRPFMKNLLPVNLSELNLHEPEGGQQEVDPKKLRESLGLSEDASDTDVLAKLSGLNSQITTLTAANVTLTAEKAAAEAAKVTAEAELAKLKDPDKIDPELQKLIDSSPAFKKLHEENLAKDRKLAEAQTAMRLSEVTRKLAELQHGKKFAITPVVRDQMRDMLVKLSDEASQPVFEILGRIVDGIGLVDLSERGKNRTGELDFDPTKRFNDTVKELMARDKGMTFADAVAQVASDHPDLYNEHRRSSYISNDVA